MLVRKEDDAVSGLTSNASCVSVSGMRPNTIVTLGDEEGKRFLELLDSGDHKPTPALEEAFYIRRQNLEKRKAGP